MLEQRDQPVPSVRRRKGSFSVCNDLEFVTERCVDEFFAIWKAAVNRSGTDLGALHDHLVRCVEPLLAEHLDGRGANPLDVALRVLAQRRRWTSPAGCISEAQPKSGIGLQL